MTLSLSNPRAKQRWVLLGVLVFILSLAAASMTLAVHLADFFEVDGDSVDDAVAGDDWDTLIGSACDASSALGGAELVTCVPDAAPETAFHAGGSKDNNDIGSWKWTGAPNGVAPGKDDIQNAYAALYLDTNGDRYIYFGMDVLPSSGTRQVGFWFLQDPDFGVAEGGSFDGAHQDNDVLVQSNFTQGGQLTNLSVFKWEAGNLVLLSETTPGAAFGCDETDTVCVAVNNAPTDLSWRAGIQTGDFFEGGINLDGLGFDAAACLASFVAETRSSAPFSARLKDFATGDFDTCAQPTTIVTSQVSGTQDAPDIAVTVGASVTDTAILSGTNAASAGGTVTYKLFSDILCATEIDDLTPTNNAVVNGVVPDSDPYVTDTVGTFYWQASYSGDDDNEPSISACADEVLTVNKASPTLPTTPNPDSGSIGDTLNDSATVTGGFNPTGDVTFTLWGPDDEDCDGTFVFQETVTLTEGSATATTTTGYTTAAAGTFAWTASYEGDDNNNSASSGCTEEEVIIGKNSPTASTAQDLIPNDTLTLSAATDDAGGTVDFYLFAPDEECGESNIANAAFSALDVALVTNDEASTSNTTFHATDEGTWTWFAVYSGDDNNDPATSDCVEEFTIENDTTP